MRQNHLWLGVVCNLAIRSLSTPDNNMKGAVLIGQPLLFLWFSSLTRSSVTAIHKKKLAPLAPQRLKRWNNRANLTNQTEVFNIFCLIQGEWSPPQSPRVHPRSRAEGALGDLGGRKEKEIHPIYNGRSIHSYTQISKRRLRFETGSNVETQHVASLRGCICPVG